MTRVVSFARVGCLHPWAALWESVLREQRFRGAFILERW